MSDRVRLLCVGGLNAGGYVEVNEAASSYEFGRLKPDAVDRPLAILSTTAYHDEVAKSREREYCLYIRHTFRAGGSSDTVDVLALSTMNALDVQRELIRGYKP